jgi:DNA-binding NarL/FixJ family response regulator
MPYKLILADDHQFLLQGVASVLTEMDEIEIVDTALNGFDLMTKVGEHRPDLVVLDLNMPGYDGLECLQRIRGGFPATKVLILTNYNQPQLLEEVKKNGGRGYLVKSSSATELRNAIRAVLSGETHFPGSDVKEVPEDSYFFDDFLKKYKLTRREVDVIRMIAREMSTKEIAAACYLSELTISTHRKNIFRKLDLKNVASLVNFAQQHNII